MDNAAEKQLLSEVIDVLKERGFEPWEQIKGYVELGDDSYITRRNGTRDEIKQIDKQLIKAELQRRDLYKK